MYRPDPMINTNFRQTGNNNRYGLTYSLTKKTHTNVSNGTEMVSFASYGEVSQKFLPVPPVLFTTSAQVNCAKHNVPSSHRGCFRG